MNTYKRHRFSHDIISYAGWLYYRFNLSHRDIEDLLAERRITVSYETIRLWCIKFGALYSRRLKRRHQGYGDTFYINEVFVKMNGKQHYLWRAVDQDGEVVDVYLQARRDGAAAKRFFKRLLRSHSGEPILGTHAAVYILFNLGRHLVSANHYRNLRIGAFKEWSLAVADPGCRIFSVWRS